MKKISVWILILVAAVSLARAQDAATQQQLDKINATLQDIQDTQALQGKRIDALERDLAALRDKVNTPVVNDSASRDDLRKLAEQVQEIDRKRIEDSENIAKQIEKLATAPAVTPLPPPHRSSESHDTRSSAPVTQVSGYEYEVKQGDTLGLIVKAYRDKGVKVTTAQVIAANPKMNPNVLIPGRKIIIPDASAK